MPDFETHELPPAEGATVPAQEAAPAPQTKKPVRKRPAKKKSQGRTRKKGAPADALAAIYEDAGASSDMTTFEAPKRRRARGALMILTAVFLLLGGASWLGYLLFGGGRAFKEAQVELTVEAPQTAQVGEKVDVVVRYENKQKLPLAKASISLRLPNDFTVTEMEQAPTDEKSLVWALGSIEKGQKGLIALHGIVIGEKGSEVSVRAFLTYRPSNFNSDFEKVASASILLDRSPYTVAFDAPERGATGEEMAFALKVKNETDHPTPPATLALAAPGEFTVTRVSPTSTAALIPRFAFPSLEPGKEFKAEVRGVFTSAPENPTLAAVITIDRNGRSYLQERVEKKITLAQTELSLKALVNGSAEAAAVQPGGTLVISVAYENKSEGAVKDAEIKLAIETPSVAEKSVVDWGGVQDTANGTVSGDQRSSTVRRGTITWTRSQVKALRELQPKGAGTIDLQVPLKTLEEFGTKALPGSTMTIAVSGSFTAGGKRVEVQGNTVAAAILSDTSLGVSVEEAGSAEATIDGSVKKVKSYEATVMVKNSLHEIETLNLSTALPKGVEWESGQAQAGDLVYDAQKRSITWTLNRMPTSVPQVPVRFKVKVVGGTADEPVAFLTDKITLTAKDKVVGEAIALTRNGAAID